MAGMLMIDIAAKKAQWARVRSAVRARKGPPPSDKFRMFLPVPSHLADERGAIELETVRQARHATYPYILEHIQIEWTTAGEMGEARFPAEQVICLLRGDVR